MMAFTARLQSGLSASVTFQEIWTGDLPQKRKLREPVIRRRSLCTTQCFIAYGRSFRNGFDSHQIRKRAGTGRIRT